MNVLSNQQNVTPGTEYPPPPNIHWAALLLTWIALSAIVLWIVPGRYQDLLNSLIVDSWVFYLCLWIQRVDPDARSPFWCDVFVIVQLSSVALSFLRTVPVWLNVVWAFLGLASAILGLVTVFLIRSDLERHYNGREPIGLHLSGVMTFFFSFLYFQSQLRPIAQFKYRQASGIVESAGRTLFS